MFAGDLWQLPPVRAIALFANPYKHGVYSMAEKKIFRMFWRREEDSIQQTFELTESKRTTDAWLKAVLKADRIGAETWEMYCFIHGLPTRHQSSRDPNTNEVTCGQKRCEGLSKIWEDTYLSPGKVP